MYDCHNNLNLSLNFIEYIEHNNRETEHNLFINKTDNMLNQYALDILWFCFAGIFSDDPVFLQPVKSSVKVNITAT